MTIETRKYPAPLYAAAGAGELAYQQLRRLPGRLTELRDRVTANDIDVRADVNRLRDVARRNAGAALGEARTVYADLVARGQKVVGGARTPEKKASIEEAKPVKRARPAASK